jgi:hypothetical protein
LIPFLVIGVIMLIVGAITGQAISILIGIILTVIPPVWVVGYQFDRIYIVRQPSGSNAVALRVSGGHCFCRSSREIDAAPTKRIFVTVAADTPCCSSQRPGTVVAEFGAGTPYGTLDALADTMLPANDPREALELEDKLTGALRSALNAPVVAGAPPGLLAITHYRPRSGSSGDDVRTELPVRPQPAAAYVPGAAMIVPGTVPPGYAAGPVFPAVVYTAPPAPAASVPPAPHQGVQL